ncbi:MAG: hypothetical protein ACI30I_05955 [Parabacteroides sp.]
MMCLTVACDDDDNSKVVSYGTPGFSTVSTSDLTEMSTISSAYKSAFTAAGILSADGYFNSSATDSKIKSAGATAEKDLEGLTFKGYYVYSVSAVNGKGEQYTVYSKAYGTPR